MKSTASIGSITKVDTTGPDGSLKMAIVVTWYLLIESSTVEILNRAPKTTLVKKFLQLISNSFVQDFNYNVFCAAVEKIMFSLCTVLWFIEP